MLQTYWIASEDYQTCYRPVGIDAVSSTEAVAIFRAKYPVREKISSVRTVNDYDNGLRS